MSENNNIDDLFRSKLTGRDVAYEQGAWQGAEQLLNKHYKMLLLKKLALILVPILTVAGIGTALLIQPETDITSTESSVDAAEIILKQDATSAENGQSASFAPTREQSPTIESNAPATPVEVSDGSEHGAPTEYLEPVAVNEPPVRENNTMTNSNSALPPVIADNQNEVSEDADDRSDKQQAQAAYASEMTPTEVAAIKLKSNLDYMDVLGLGGLSEYNRDPSFGDVESPAMQALRKTQLYGDFGALVALGQHDLMGKRMGPGLGAYVQLTARYHFQQSVFMDFGLGVFNRSSLTKNVNFTGNQPMSAIEITPLSAQYASINFGFGYRIGARHSVGIGMRFNPLLTVLARKETSIDGEVTDTKYISDANGFNKLDVGFDLNYRVSISERWDAMAALQLGFFDATDNNVFQSGDITDRNHLLKTGLSYRITKR